MKLSKKLNIFKKSYKLVKKLWKKTKKGTSTNRELEPVNVEMFNSSSSEVECNKCSKNLISEDVISETSYMSLTSVVREESTSEKSGANVDLTLEKSSIVYAPEFMQNEGEEKNLALPGVELETQKSVSKILPSEENITTEKPVSTLATQEQPQADIEDDHGREFYSKSRYTLTRLLYAPKKEELRTYQTPEEFIAQIEAEHKAKKDALSQLPEPDFTFFISTPSTNNDIASLNSDNNTSSVKSDNNISPSNTDNTTPSLLPLPENTTSFHSDININSHSNTILPIQTTDDITHSPENPSFDDVILPDTFNSISFSDTSSSSSHSDTLQLELAHGIIDSSSKDIADFISSLSQIQEDITTITEEENDIADFISSLIQEDTTTNIEDDIAAFISSLSQIQDAITPNQVPVTFTPLRKRKSSFETSKNQYFEYINNFDHFDYDEGYFDEIDAEPDNTVNNTNNESLVNIESLTNNTNVEPEIEHEHETFITMTMHFELITTGNIEEHEESQSDLVHHEEVLQVGLENEQETIATNDQVTEFNLEEFQSDLVLHNEVLQVESETDHETIAENNQEVEATNGQASEFEFEESQSDLVPHEGVLLVDSENDQKVAINPEAQSDNQNNIVIKKESNIKEDVTKKEMKDDSSDMNVFPLHTLSLEKEMEIFLRNHSLYQKL